MARVFAVLASLAVIASVHATLAMPQESAEKNDVQESSPVTVLPNADNLRFFFNFWPFKPLPWIPLPGLNRPTPATEAPATPAPAEEEEAGEDEDEGEGGGDEETDGAGDGDADPEE